MRILLIAILFLTPILPQQSELSKGVNYLSEFIASEYFDELSSQNSDLTLVDTIYLRAVNLYDEEYSEALLALTFATIPYREVPLVLPLINAQVYYPLISADEKTFIRKNEKLPTKFFYDTPNNDFGDKDKLAHFFGNAFIGYAENIFDLANVFGYFVEAFEEDFKAQSKVDYRDIDVNWYGELFGNLLENNEEILPSQIMLLRSLKYLRFSL